VTAGFLAASLLVSHGVRRDATAVFEHAGRYIVVNGGKVRHLRPDQDSAEGYIRAVLHGKARHLGADITGELPLQGPCLNVTLIDGEDIFGLDLRKYNSFIYGGRLEECETGFTGSELPIQALPVIVNILLDRMLVS